MVLTWNCKNKVQPDTLVLLSHAGLANGGEMQPASSEAELKEKLRQMVEAQKAIDPDFAKLKGAPRTPLLVRDDALSPGGVLFLPYENQSYVAGSCRSMRAASQALEYLLGLVGWCQSPCAPFCVFANGLLRACCPHCSSFLPIRQGSISGTRGAPPLGLVGGCQPPRFP